MPLFGGAPVVGGIFQESHLLLSIRCPPAPRGQEFELIKQTADSLLVPSAALRISFSTQVWLRTPRITIRKRIYRSLCRADSKYRFLTPYFSDSQRVVSFLGARLVSRWRERRLSSVDCRTVLQPYRVRRPSTFANPGGPRGVRARRDRRPIAENASRNQMG